MFCCDLGIGFCEDIAKSTAGPNTDVADVASDLDAPKRNVCLFGELGLGSCEDIANSTEEVNTMLSAVAFDLDAPTRKLCFVVWRTCQRVIVM